MRELSDRATVLAVEAERGLQRELQGGCRLPLGAWARFEGDELMLDAVVLAENGGREIRGGGRAMCKTYAEALTLGATVAREMLAARCGRVVGGGGARGLVMVATSMADAREAARGKAHCGDAGAGAGGGTERGAECAGRARAVDADDEFCGGDGFCATRCGALDRVGEFDWLVFASQNAVRFVSQRLLETRTRASTVAFPSLSVAAVGQATATASNAAGFRVTYTAKNPSGESLASELAHYVAGKNVLLPRSDRGDARLMNGLRESRARR